MARMYKITAFIVDPNEIYQNGEECFSYLIDRSHVFCPTQIDHEDVDFEWNNSVIVNHFGCTTEDCERFMDKCRGDNEQP